MSVYRKPTLHPRTVVRTERRLGTDAPRSMSPLTVMASTQFPVAQLPRVVSSSHAAVATFIDTASPVVITPDVTKMGVGRLQTPNDLRRAFRGESVTVSVGQDGTFRGQAGSKSLMRRMSFDDFANYVENSDGQSIERLYLSQFPLDTTSLVLGSDLTARAFIPESSCVLNTNLWFGPSGTISPLHFDQNHNLLLQHWGRKHVVLVDPCQFHSLKPGRKNSSGGHVSSLDLVTSGFNVDLSRLNFPCLETVLEPGDVLFVPALWWHHVMSIDVAISINYWWRAPISACLYPGLFRFLSSRSVYDDPSVVARSFDLGRHRLDTGLCLFLADEGHTFGAAALAGAMVTAFCGKALRMLGILTSTRLASEGLTGDLPDLTQARTVIRALTAQDLINNSQANLLLKWLELAEETAAEPGLPVYAPERSKAIRSMIWRLHVECGRWLSM